MSEINKPMNTTSDTNANNIHQDVSTNVPFALSRTLSPAARVYQNAHEARLMPIMIQRVSDQIKEQQGFLWRLHCIMQDESFKSFLDCYGKTAADMSVLTFYFKLYQNVQHGYRKRYTVEPSASYMLFFMKQIMTDSRYRSAAMQAFKAFNEEETVDYTFVDKLIDHRDQVNNNKITAT